MVMAPEELLGQFDQGAGLPQWLTLGWPSEKAWQEAGSPLEPYKAPVFDSPLKPANSYTVQAPPQHVEAGPGVPGTIAAPPSESGLIIPDAGDVRLSSENPFISGLNADLFAKAQGGLQDAAQQQQLRDLQVQQDEQSMLEASLFGPQATAASAGTPFVDAGAQGTLRGQLEAERQGSTGYGAIAEGLKDPQALALLGGGLFLPELAATAGVTPASGALFAAPRVSQETLGLDQLPGAELGDLAREHLPGELGNAVGGGLQVALDPTTLAGAGLKGTGLVGNLLGRGGMSPNAYLASVFGAGAAAPIGGDVSERLGLGRTSGQVVAGLGGGVLAPAALKLTGGGLSAAANALKPSAKEMLPQDVIDAIRGMSMEDRLQLSLDIGQSMGPDAVRELGSLMAQAEAGDMRAASELGSRFFRDNAVLRNRASELSQRMDAGLPRAGLVGESGAVQATTAAPGGATSGLDKLKATIVNALTHGEDGSVRMPGFGGGESTPKPTQVKTTPQSLDDLGKMATEEQYLRGQGTGAAPAAPKPGINWWNEAMGVLGAPRTLTASGDIGGLTRQAQRLGWWNPSEWKAAAQAGIEALKSKDAALASQAAVETNPLYNLAKDSGLKFYEWGEGAVSDARTPSFTGLNESRVSSLLGKAPWIGPGERGHATLLNVQGMEVFNKYAQAMIDAGVRDKQEFRDLATVINHARGYGTGSMTDAMSSLNVFFSARNMNSLWQTMFDPFTKSGSLFRPSARQLAAKSLAGMVGGQTALLTLFGVTGALTGQWSVDANPLSSDFGKIKVGNTRFDTMAGYAPIVRLVSRIGAQALDATVGTDLADEWTDWRSELVRFFRNKLGPAPGIIASVLAGEDWKGDPYKLSDILQPEMLADMTLPMIVMSAYESVKDNEGAGKALVGLVTPAELVGIGTSTYTTPTGLRDDEAKSEFGSSYGSLSPIQQAKVDSKLGDRLDDSAITRPYWAADDAAFEKAKAANPEALGQFKDLDAFRAEVERRVVEKAQESGQQLQTQDIDAAVTKVENALGLDKSTKAFRLAAVAANPAIVDALQRRYDAGEQQSYPGQTYRDLADLIRSDPAAAQRILDQLAAQGYE